MPVLRHQLRVSRWGRLPAVFDGEVVPTGTADLPAVLGGLCRACRGHGGLGEAVSPAGLAAACDPKRVTHGAAWTLRGGPDGPMAAIALAGRLAGGGVRWSIPFLLVAPPLRRTGLALTLVRAALAEADRREALWVYAETLSTWDAASGFWRAVVRRLEG